MRRALASAVLGLAGLWPLLPASVSAEENKPPAGLEVTVSGATATLRQYQTGHAYVIVHNASASALTLTALSARAPDGVVVCAAFDLAATCEGNQYQASVAVQMEREIPPGDSPVFHWLLDGRREEGQHPLAFTAEYVGADGKSRAASATVQVAVSVLGDSGPLDALKVSFLFLPGVLALVVFYFLANIRPLPEWAKRLAPTNPEFWAVAVLLSLLAIPLYPSLTSGYSMRDVVTVWVASVAAGAALAIVYFVARAVVQAVHRTYLNRRTPAPDDSPKDALTKLVVRRRWLRGAGARHRGLWFPQVRVKDGDREVQMLKLVDVPSAPPACWVAPPIDVQRSDLGADWSGLAQRHTRGDLKKVVKRLNAAETAWARLGAFAGPVLLQSSDLATAPRLADRLIVQERQV